MSDETDTQTAPDSAKAALGVVDSIRKYVASEDGAAKAILQPVGAAGVRITLIGEKNGILGDRMVPSLAVAKDVVGQVEGMELAEEWDRELTNKATITPSHWRKMAGWVAHQKHFPKPRNRKIVDYRG